MNKYLLIFILALCGLLFTTTKDSQLTRVHGTKLSCMPTFEFHHISPIDGTMHGHKIEGPVNTNNEGKDMIDTVSVMKELELHISFMHEGTMGRLLNNCHRLLIRQGKELEELKHANMALKRKGQTRHGNR